MRFDLRQFVLPYACLAFLIGCGTVIGNPEEKDGGTDNPQALAELPEISSIQLKSLGQSASLRLDGDDCGALDSLGVFGFSLASVCHTSQFVGGIMYGEDPDTDADGKVDCDDYTGDDQGILFPLLCEQNLLTLSNIESLAFNEPAKNEYIAFSFADFDDGMDHDSIGHWNARGPDGGRYPAKMRLWDGTARDSLIPRLYLQMTNQREGHVFIDVEEEDITLLGDTEYSIKQDDELPNCVTDPSKEKCHWQDIKLKGSETDADAPLPAGYRVFVMTDKKEDASIIVLEGKLRYTTAQAANFITDNEDLPGTFADIRTIYFRNVQKGDQIWGTFDFQDENGDTIVAEVTDGATTTDLADLFRNGTESEDYAGVCQNLGSDEVVACTDIEPSDYDDIWQGDKQFDGVSTNYDFSIEFGETPPEGVTTK